MEAFYISEVYQDELGRETVGVSPLADKCCSFDCVYCALGPAVLKTTAIQEIKGTADFLRRYAELLEKESFEVLYFDPNGEALANGAFGQMVALAKSYGKIVRILSNACAFNDPCLRGPLNACDEITVEVAVADEADYQRIHRPVAGMTLQKNIDILTEFAHQYPGQLTLCFLALKGISDNEAAADYYCQVVRRVLPSRVEVATLPPGEKSSPLMADSATVEKMRLQIADCFNQLRN